MIGSFISWLSDTLYSAFCWLLSTVFSSCYDLLKSFYISLKNILSDGDFCSIGSDFFGFIYNSSVGSSFSFNIVYYFVGLLIFFFVIKKIVLPLAVALVQGLLDLFTIA